ncbi:hypothetical protein E2C01_066536 [Portunus trituberculatus]|uniref:Uncharacterized protein n=1 Tax=Portunus trituberculatus TaxID=210409 RepID=A0A5B7HU35_PORTR|nr:hypothetical protein [Portunus trituberculatus]
MIVQKNVMANILITLEDSSFNVRVVVAPQFLESVCICVDEDLHNDVFCHVSLFLNLPLNLCVR